MAVLTVPVPYATIAEAISAAAAGDTILVGASYGGNESATVTKENLTFNAPLAVPNIVLTLGSGIVSATLIGSAEITLIGNGLANTLTGSNIADDFIRGRAGADTINGRGGFDFADYRQADGAVTVTLTDAALPGGPTGGTSSGPDGADTLISIEGVRGGNFNDTLTGNSEDNFLRGGLGNDTIDGRAGEDWADYRNAAAGVSVTLTDAAIPGGATGGTSSGADGVDTLIAIERIRGGDFNDTLTGNSSDNFLRGRLGDDALNGRAGADWADYHDSDGPVHVELTDATAPGGATGGFSLGAAGDDTLISIENIRGGHFDDFLFGNSGDNFLRGERGDDLLDGRGGEDWADYRRALGAVTVTLTGGPGGPAGGFSSGADGFDTLADIENVRGSDFNDTLTGNAFDNTLRGGLGRDTLVGGGGFDFASYRNATTGLVANLANAAANTGEAFGDAYNSIEGLSGTDFNDRLVGDAVSNSFRGWNGNDVIDGAGSTDIVLYDLDASEGGTAGVVVNLSAAAVNVGGVVAANTARDGFGDVDTLIGIEEARGTNTADHFFGGAGYNFFQGRGGADRYDGGNSTAFFASYRIIFDARNWVDYRQDGGTAGVTVNLATGTGVDTFGAAETYTNINTVRGSMQADTFTGDQFFNYFQPIRGADTVNGGGGYDRVDYTRDASFGGFAGVTVNLTTGVATDGFGNTDTLSNIEEVDGTSFADSITGNSWDNFLESFFGNDTLVGRDGFDTMVPGLGDDIVNGAPVTGVDQGFDDRDRVRYSDLGPVGGLGVIVNLSTGAVTFEGHTVAGNRARDTGGFTDTLIDIERAQGTTGRDYFRGSDTANLRNEQFRGFAGDDYIHGGAGFNVASYFGETSGFDGAGAGGTAGVIVNLSTAAITVGGNTVAAGRARDAFGNTDTLVNIRGIVGTGLADHVVGGGGFNHFQSVGGADFFDGGAGDRDTLSMYMDELFFGTAGSGSVINMVAGTATNFLGGATTTFVNVEDIEGSERGDTITGNAGANTLSGDHGNDSIDGGAGNDVISGGTGNDTLAGGAGFDLVSYLSDPTAAAWALLQRPGLILSPIGGVNANLATGTAADPSGYTDTLSGFEGVAGTFFNDTLTGDANDNTFLGFSGNDTINGGAGNDTVSYEDFGNTAGSGAPDLFRINASRPNGVTVNLAAGTADDSEGGDDTLNSIENVIGSTGDDSIDGSAAANVLDGGLGDDFIFGDDGNDMVKGGVGNDLLGGGEGNDEIDGGVGNDYFEGAEGDDEIHGGDGDDDIHGGDGDDVLDGGAGNDILSDAFGGEGNDHIDGGDGDDALSGGFHDDVLFGDAGNDVLFGDAGNDELDGDDGNDHLVGGEGNDTLSGGLGNDVFNGGDDVDTAHFTGAHSNITANLALAGPQNTGQGFDSFTAIENLIGSSNADTLTGNASANYLYGAAGNDALAGGDGNDSLRGGLGNDVLSGGAGIDAADFTGAAGPIVASLALAGAQNTGQGFDTFIGLENLIGSANADTLTGNGDANRLDGGDGADALDGGAGNDDLAGGGGNDRLRSGLGNDIVNGGLGIDTADLSTAAGPVAVNLALAGTQNTGQGFDSFLDVENAIGGGSADILTGNGGANRFDGAAGNDVLLGGGGNDTLNGDSGDDIILADTGDDAVDGGAGNDSIDGGSGNDQIFGNLGNDQLYGGVGNDAIFGGAGSDTLVGNAGIDRIDGGDGVDKLTADATADTFVFTSLAGAGDTITGFLTTVHKLQVTAAGFGGTAGAFTFASGANPAPASAVRAFLYDTDDGRLYFDADGSGAGARVHVLTLLGAPTLAAGDVLLV